MQFSVIVVCVAVPLHCIESPPVIVPLTVKLPSLLIVPLNWYPSPVTEKLQPFCVTVEVSPIASDSQCWVIFRFPRRSGSFGWYHPYV